MFRWTHCLTSIRKFVLKNDKNKSRFLYNSILHFFKIKDIALKSKVTLII